MAKNTQSIPGRCVHCLREVEEITDDHLFPRSWYPTTTPQILEKWKFPACLKCNRDYGKLEEDLRLLLAACLDPKGEASAGIWTRALDSMNPAKARNRVDEIRRNNVRRRFLKRVREVDPTLLHGALPEIHPNRPRGNLGLLVPAESINKFIEKLVRGTVYLTERRYIEQHQEITASVLSEEDGAPSVNLLEQFGELYERGPGIRIRKGVADDARTNALFIFDIWDQFRFHAALLDRE